MRILLIALTLAFSISSFPIYADNNPAITFTFASTSFLDQSTLPTLYTCDGRDISPELTWSNPPVNTQSFAIIFSDIDSAGGRFFHWIIYNLPKTTLTLAEGINQLPTGTTTGRNSWGKLKYNGPCPPKGSIHHYVFKLYALDTQLNITGESDGQTVLDAMQHHILGNPIELNAVYTRWVQ